MKGIIKYALVIIAIVPLPFSCDETDDGGPCPDTGYDLGSIETLQINGEPIANNDTIDLTNLAIAIVFEVSKSGTAMAPTDEMNFRSLLFPTAMALSCIGPHTDEVIRELRITSNRDFNDNYPAGTDLRDLFTSSYRLGETSINDLYVDVTGFGQSALSALRGFTSVELNVLPGISEVHVFTLDITLSGGRTFQVTTSPIRFN